MPDTEREIPQASTAPHVGDRRSLYCQFWSELLSELHDVQPPRWPRTGAPSRKNWMSFKSANPCVKYLPSFRRNDRLIAQAYIDCKDGGAVESIFIHLRETREALEERFGGELCFDPGKGRRFASVYIDYPDEISIEDTDRWPEAQEWLVSTLSRLRDAIDPEVEDR